MVFEGKRVSACFRIGREGRDHGWTANSKCKKAVSILVADTGIKPKKIDYWFTDFRNLRFADLSKLDTSDVQHAGGLFCGCEQLEEVLMPAIGLPSAVRTACMFRNCRSLTKLDMAGYDLHNAVDLHCMFSRCGELKQVGAATWAIPHASDVNKMLPSPNHGRVASSVLSSEMEVSSQVSASLVEANPLSLVVSVPTTLPVEFEMIWNCTPTAGLPWPLSDSQLSSSPPLVLAISTSNACGFSAKSSSGSSSYTPAFTTSPA